MGLKDFLRRLWGKGEAVSEREGKSKPAASTEKRKAGKQIPADQAESPGSRFDPQVLRELVLEGRMSKVVTFFRGATQAERRQLAPEALELYDRFNINRALREVAERNPHGFTWNPNGELMQRHKAAAAAMLSSAQWGKCRKRDIVDWLLMEGDALCRIMRDRRPKWVASLAKFLLSGQSAPGAWPRIRQMEREGLCDRLEDHAYYEAFARWFSWSRDISKSRRQLLNDPELLENHIWWVFRVELNRSAGMGQWIDLLAGFVAGGQISRGRVLDETLDAMERDFHKNWARTYPTLMARLEVTTDELAERTDRLLGLLGARAPSTIQWALKALGALDKAKRLTGDCVGRLVPVMTAKAKGTVKRGFTLLKSLVRKNPTVAGDAVLAAADALGHSSADVGQWALDFIEKHGRPTDAQLRDRVTGELEFAPPAIHAAIQQWLASGDDEQDEAVEPPEPICDMDDLRRRAGEIDPRLVKFAGVSEALDAVNGGGLPPALPLASIAVPRFDPTLRIKPVEDLDELIDLLAMLVEGQGSGDDMERAFDGLSRLCSLRPDDLARRTKALLQRVLGVKSSYEDLFPRAPALLGHPRWHLGPLVLAWLAPKEYQQRKARMIQRAKKYNWGGWEEGQVVSCSGQCAAGVFMGIRTWEIIERILAGREMPLVASPTHSGGWLDPVVLVDRVLQWQAAGLQTSPADQIQSLLRLAPNHRGQAAAKATELTGEFAQALRYALGCDEPVGENTALWIAAARARSPYRDDLEVDARHPDAGPDGGRLARYELCPRTERAVRSWNRENPNRAWTAGAPVNRKPVPALRVMVAFHREDYGMDGYDAFADDIVTQVHPLNRQSLLARGAALCLMELDVTFGASKAYFDPLFDPDEPLGEIGTLAVLAAISVKDASVSGLGVDAAIACIEDGRLDGILLGQASAELLIKEDAPRPKKTTGWRTVTPVRLKPSRWPGKLSEVARTSPLHSAVVRQGLVAMLRPDLPLKPRDALGFFELLHGLCVELGEAVDGEGARCFLASIEGKGKTAKLAGALLQLERTSDNSNRREAALFAAACRIERAERWGRWVQEDQER